MGRKSEAKKIAELEDALRSATTAAAVAHLREFEAAKRTRRTENWYTREAGPNVDLKAALPMLVRRHQDLVDNNPWCSRAIEVITGSWIGDGIIGAPGPGGTKQFGRLWQDWVESTDCDFYGKLNFYGLQELWSRTTATRGSCLIRRRVSSDLQRRGMVPLQLQVLEPDWLDVSKDDGVGIIGGKQHDDQGRVTGYWIRDRHPGETFPTSFRGRGYTSQLVPTSDVIHTYRIRRPGQYSDAPWGAAVMLRLRDMDDYEGAELLKQKLAACFTAFVYESDPESLASGMPLSEKLEPGAIEILPPGKQITFAQPPSVTAGGEFLKHWQHSVAVGYGITFESLTGILSDVNFSSGRMGRLDFVRNVAKWRWNVTIPQALNPIGRWFGDLTANMQVRPPSKMIWTPPPLAMVNPKEEIETYIVQIRAGLLSLSEVQRMLGYVPEELLEECRQDWENVNSKGLILTSDPAQDPERLKAAQLTLPVNV